MNLLPCPFCGSTSPVCRLYAVSTVLSGAKTRRGKPSLTGWSVECLACQASVRVESATEDAKERAAARWNRRAETEAERIAGMALKQAAAMEIAQRAEEQARANGDSKIHERDVASRRRALKERNL